MILVGWIARRARHACAATAALMLAIPRKIIVRLAHPVGVAAAGALHCTPQDRPLSHRAARSAVAAARRRSCTRQRRQPLPTSHPARTRRRDSGYASASTRRARAAASPPPPSSWVPACRQVRRQIAGPLPHLRLAPQPPRHASLHLRPAP